jgi:hypothetical protein
MLAEEFCLVLLLLADFALINGTATLDTLIEIRKVYIWNPLLMA